MGAASALGRDASILSPPSQAFGADEGQLPTLRVLDLDASGAAQIHRRRTPGSEPVTRHLISGAIDSRRLR